MAKPGQLRKAVAEALGLHEQLESVDVHLRNLREAGHITKAKKGGGAADMNPDDALNLLLAVAGSDRTKDSVKTVECLRSLPRTSIRMRSNERPHHELWRVDIPLANLPEHHAFSDALREVLILLRDAELFTPGLRDQFYRSERHVHATQPTEYLFVHLVFPMNAAAIMFGIRGRIEIETVYGPLRTAGVQVWDLRRLQAEGQLLTIRAIDLKSLKAIAEAIA
ncbi:hypothetical protein [Bradyrhizobium niftali]|jgi:hypothetical protein|uniref:Uncharacterized protein n=1 Tax=Bradyrhizobium niftali TaxID=2560055 RepID=A0A4Y9LRD0_9BRAD|nr:hypothetical protein [Bradyrhizobium niftali]TFV45064.1 hypothetical protein E4K65_26345 [Bradyrhizobium niftali]